MTDLIHGSTDWATLQRNNKQQYAYFGMHIFLFAGENRMAGGDFLDKK